MSLAHGDRMGPSGGERYQASSSYPNPLAWVSQQIPLTSGAAHLRALGFLLSFVDPLKKIQLHILPGSGGQ